MSNPNDSITITVQAWIVKLIALVVGLSVPWGIGVTIQLALIKSDTQIIGVNSDRINLNREILDRHLTDPQIHYAARERLNALEEQIKRLEQRMESRPKP